MNDYITALLISFGVILATGGLKNLLRKSALRRGRAGRG